MNERMQIWFDCLTRNFHSADGRAGAAPPFNIQYCIDEGKKYYKISYSISYNENRPNSKKVHAFVDKVTGDVYKPATWRSPAKHVRYNLLNDESFNNMIEKCDWAGGYLYIN